MSKILLVEDDVQLRMVFRQMLEHAGHDVECAGDGKSACALFAGERFDLVVTDLVMPEKDGFETLRDLRMDAPEVKVIVISGGGRYWSPTYLSTAEALGADRTLRKPIRMRDFLEAVEQTLAA